jgi:chorismate mutase
MNRVATGVFARAGARKASAMRRVMDIAEWRKKIDELDRKVVELLNQRAKAAQEIGKLKRGSDLPIYEPNREKAIFDNVRGANKGPLPDSELQHIFERIIDVMRAIQKQEIRPAAKAAGGETEFDIEVNE